MRKCLSHHQKIHEISKAVWIHLLKIFMSYRREMSCVFLIEWSLVIILLMKTSFGKFIYDELGDFYSTAFEIQLADKIFRINHIHSRTIHFVPDIWIFVQIFHLGPKPSLTLFVCCPRDSPVEIRGLRAPGRTFCRDEKRPKKAIICGRASFIHFFWLTVLSTTVLSTKNRVFAKSQFYPLLEISLKIPFYPLFSQMKRLLARFVI